MAFQAKATPISSDIVGYAASDLQNGFTAKGASFIPVTGTAIDLQDIKVTGYEGENADTVQIQILDTLGRATVAYYWADLPDDDIYGWLNDDEEVAQGVSFQPGSGLWVKSTDATVKLQTAGKVPESDIQVGLVNGFSMVANPMPETLDLQDVIVAGYEGENADTVQIQLLDTLGRTTVAYYWADLPDDDIYGWLNDEEEIAEHVSIGVGEALWIKSTDAALSVQFKTPLVD